MIAIIVQARMGSTRLPGKVLKKIGEKRVIDHVFERLSKSKIADSVILATTVSENDNPLAEWAVKNNYPFYRGSEEDVLSRYYEAAKAHQCDIIVRVTSDCPFIDYEIVDKAIQTFVEDKKADYVSNVHPPTYPDGMDVEVFSFASLSEANKKASKKHQREHVTPYIWENKDTFVLRNITCDKDHSKLRCTLDTAEDLSFLRVAYKEINNHYFLLKEFLEFVKENTHSLELNHHLTRNSNF